MNSGHEAVASRSYNSAAFYRHRADQSRQMETTAKDPMIAMIHRDLAARYDVLAHTAHQQENI